MVAGDGSLKVVPLTRCPRTPSAFECYERCTPIWQPFAGRGRWREDRKQTRRLQSYPARSSIMSIMQQQRSICKISEKLLEGKTFNSMFRLVRKSHALAIYETYTEPLGKALCSSVSDPTFGSDFDSNLNRNLR